VALRWDPADGCLDTARLYALVHSRRRPVGADAASDAIVSGRARMSATGGWDVELVVADRRGAVLGRRSLSVAAGGCEALREHVALVVAMLVDSSVVERAADIARADIARADIARADIARADIAPGRERWGGDVALAIAGEVGRLPGTVPGLAMSAGLSSPGGWRADIAMSAFAAATASDPSGRTSLRWLAAAASGCAPGLAPAGWRLTGCVGLEVGALLARGDGFERNQRDRELMVDALGRLRIERRLVGRTFAALGVGVRIAVRRPRVGYEDESGQFQPLYEPSWAAVTADLGLGAHFP